MSEQERGQSEETRVEPHSRLDAEGSQRPGRVHERRSLLCFPHKKIGWYRTSFTGRLLGSVLSSCVDPSSTCSTCLPVLTSAAQA